jgi:hypothetical protein
MPIAEHYDKTAVVLRLSDESGDTEGYQSHIAAVPCHVQPLDDSFSQDMNGNFGKDYLMFCDPKDIQEEDRVILEGIGYRVVGVERYRFRNEDRHMEIRIRRSLD